MPALILERGRGCVVGREPRDVAPLIQKPPTTADLDHRMLQQQAPRRHYDIGFSETDADLGSRAKILCHHVSAKNRNNQIPL